MNWRMNERNRISSLSPQCSFKSQSRPRWHVHIIALCTKHHGILHWLEHNSYARTVPISCAVITMTWHLAPFLCPHGKITLSLLCCLSLGKECSWQPCGHQYHIAWSHSQPRSPQRSVQHRSRTQTYTIICIAYCCCKLLLEYCNQPQVTFVRVEIVGGSQVYLILGSILGLWLMTTDCEDLSC